MAQAADKPDGEFTLLLTHKEKPSSICANRFLLSVKTRATTWAARKVQSSRLCAVKWFKARSFFNKQIKIVLLCFWFRFQDGGCDRRSFGSFLSAAVGHWPKFCRSLSPWQDQHRVDPAPAAGPADPHGEPQLHSSGSPAGAWGHWKDTTLWRLQQNHQVRLHNHFYSWKALE